jgi:DeoR/GlpR family transcriptional regulator of sugar metabolism
MILAQLRDYLSERGPVPVGGLAARFEVAPETMRGMLSHLVRRGLVRPVSGEEFCGGCTKCDTDRQELYAWSRKEDIATGGSGQTSSLSPTGTAIHST